jgi:hypothetical protein
MANLRPRGADPIAIIETLSDISEGLGEWIAGPVPDNDIAAAIQQRYRDQCDAYSNAPGWLTAFSTPSTTTMSNICNPWLESQGSGDPVLDVPFTGGQCPGVEYEITLKYEASREDCDGGSATALTPREDVITGFGPISAPFIRQDVASDCGTRTGRACVNAFDVNGDPVVLCTQTITSGRPDRRLVNESVTVTNGPVRVDGLNDDCGDLPGTPAPNPNPRPNPGFDPEDEPFEDPEGRPLIPMPPITGPFGEPVQLPNLPLPDLFGEVGAGGGSNPNVGPPVEPGTEQTGGGVNGEDDDFPEPPEGSIYVGFIVKMSDQGVSEGLQVNSPPEPIYRATTGNYRAIYEIDGSKVYSTPKRIQSETSVYWLDLSGLTLVGARVNVPSNDSYVVTPLYQAETESEPQQV